MNAWAELLTEEEREELRVKQSAFSDAQAAYACAARSLWELEGRLAARIRGEE